MTSSFWDAASRADSRAGLPRSRGRVALCACLLLGWHCTSSTEGLSLDIVFGLHRPDGAAVQEGAPRVVHDAADHAIELRQAFAVITELELVPCEVQTASAWAPFTLGRAHAHGRGSARVLAVPHVIDLSAGTSGALALANMQPPPGDYCWVRLRIDAADADAVGLPDTPDLVNASLVLEAAVGADATALRLRAAIGRDIELPLIDTTGQGALRLGSPGQSPSLRVNLDTAALFEDADVLQDDLDVLGFIAIDNLLRTATVHVCGSDGNCQP